jgi:hypothetical protein
MQRDGRNFKCWFPAPLVPSSLTLNLFILQPSTQLWVCSLVLPITSCRDFKANRVHIGTAVTVVRENVECVDGRRQVAGSPLSPLKIGVLVSKDRHFPGLSFLFWKLGAHTISTPELQDSLTHIVVHTFWNDLVLGLGLKLWLCRPVQIFRFP